MANCTLEPPVSTPISRMMAMAASRMIWYSRSVRVWAGATVMESPVCTPMGSKFSMGQMMTTLSLASRITSSSNSFQPNTDSSEHHLAGHGGGQALGGNGAQIVLVVDHAAAGAAQGVGRAHHHGEADIAYGLHHLVHVAADAAFGAP